MPAERGVDECLDAGPKLNGTAGCFRAADRGRNVGSPIDVRRGVSLRRVVILHGYLASPRDHWFGSLAASLTDAGIDVAVPALPRSDAPELETWVRAAAEAIGTPDAETGIVTHSLGTLTALHALDQTPGEWNLGAFVGVAGFITTVPGLELLDDFARPAPDVARTAVRTGARLAVFSDNDAIVPPSLSQQFADAMDATRTVVAGAGHFLASEGVTELPAAADFLLGR